MLRIRQLEAQVVNRIAAGEVIERPASVVKELLENCIDALATRIEVDLKAGGTELIRIVDNGEGIHPDDMTLAVTSHATSKIETDQDLTSVSTLGFRGEALASIASVSQFRIRSRTADADSAIALDVNGGVVGALTNCAGPHGTVIEVHNLFFNTPARRKFLKRPATEYGHISEQFARIALANPRLRMVLRHNEKTVYDLPAATDQIDRCRKFYGEELADRLIPVESNTETTDGRTIRLWGYVGHPSLSKSTRKSQYLFLNGRWIQDRSLQHALSEAYRGLLMVGRYPVCFLFLELPGDMVDVNVHPTKMEVRFRDSSSLYRQLLHTIRAKFLSLELTSEMSLSSSLSPSAATPSAAGPAREEGRSAATGAVSPQKELSLWASTAATTASPLPRVADFGFGSSSFVSTRTRHDASNVGVMDGAAVVGTDAPVEERPEFEQGFGSFGCETGVPEPGPISGEVVSAAQPSIDTGGAAISEASSQEASDEIAPSVVDSAMANDREATSVRTDEYRAFQLHDCYLIVATDEGLTVIDQHALHERILYEHFRERVLSGAVERQKLLIPEAVECSPAEFAALCEHRELIAEIGFSIEEFGGHTMLLTGHPTMLPRGVLKRMLRDLAEQLETTDGKVTRRDLLDSMLHTMACRAAIKSGHRLSREEMQELLRQRHLVDDTHHCPHGRPTSLVLTRGSLDRQFGRLG